MTRFLCFKSQHHPNDWVLVTGHTRKSFPTWEAARDWAVIHAPVKRSNHRSFYSRKKQGWQKENPYLAWIASLPCFVCGTRFRVEVAHIGPRAFGQKCAPRQTAPLCRNHHREGQDSHHVLGKRFWAVHSIDREALILSLNREYGHLERAA